jgi:hypothetical protein
MVCGPPDRSSTALTAPLGAASGLAPDTALIPASSLSPTHLVHHSPFGGTTSPTSPASRPRRAAAKPADLEACGLHGRDPIMPSAATVKKTNEV